VTVVLQLFNSPVPRRVTQLAKPGRPDGGVLLVRTSWIGLDELTVATKRHTGAPRAVMRLSNAYSQTRRFDSTVNADGFDQPSMQTV
jgi:hypothetical protein